MKLILKKMLKIVGVSVMAITLFSCKNNGNSTSNTSNIEIIEKDANAMIEFELTSYSGAISSYSGMPIKLKIENENTIFECKTEESYFTSSYFKGKQKQIFISPNTTFVCLFRDYESGEYFLNTFIDIIARIDENIVGYAVIILNSKAEWAAQHPDILESKIFPKINGEYQNISLDYVKERISLIKEEYNNLPKV